MTSETLSKTTKLCPTCGTRLSEEATRCLVCGSELSSEERPKQAAKAVEGSRMPEITLSLPVALALLVVFLGIGAALVFFGLRQTGRVVEPTVTPTITLTVTPTITPTPLTPTSTSTPLPTPTPISYTVKAGDYCATIAHSFSVSIQSIVLLNDLPADCGLLLEGQKLLIPQPTPTGTPFPTATLSAAEQTEQACLKDTYLVKETDTLSSIALSYNVPMSVIREYNGMSSDVVFSGMPLIIPLCKRNVVGPTPTPTAPPPYLAPNLLLPADGADFSRGNETVTLQWASIGALAANEAYAVTIVDVTDDEDRRLVEYVTDTKFIVPETFRPSGASPHALYWWVTTIRQTGTDEDGNPIRESAGATSLPRVFIWAGISAPEFTPTP
jgi:LysM repeat protein/ribosomal protein L40E